MSDSTPPPPPPGGGTPPPPPGAGTPPPSGGTTPPPPGGGTAPPPPGGGSYAAPPGGYGQPQAGNQPGYQGGYGPPPGAYGPRPGELLDRFLARLIDLVLVGVTAGVLNAIIAVVFGFSGGFAGYGGGFAFGAVSAVVSTVIYLGYFTYMESSQGKTLGKMIMKLRVVGPDGGNPSLETAAKRNIWLGLPILGIVPILGGLVAFVGEVAAIVMCAVGISNDPQRRHWFDQFAGGTQVLKEG